MSKWFSILALDEDGDLLQTHVTGLRCEVEDDFYEVLQRHVIEDEAEFGDFLVDLYEDRPRCVEGHRHRQG